MTRRLLILVLAVLAMAHAAGAHPVFPASAVAVVRPDNTLKVTVRCDALALALNDLPARINDAEMHELVTGTDANLEHALAAGRSRFQTLLHIVADDQPLPVRVLAAPTVENVRAWIAAHPTLPVPVKLDFVAVADLPPEAGTVRIKFPGILGDLVLTVQPLHAEALATLVPVGELSEAFPIRGAAPARAPTSPHAESPVPTPPHAAPAVSSPRSAALFVWLGVTHILPSPTWFAQVWAAARAGSLRSRPGTLIPDGIDHILFVLALFFLSPRLRPLLIQVTTFTLAHSITLALSARGVVHMPASIVEPVIAASICLVAVENLCTQKVHAWRPIIVFAFGLIHGLGFASAFAEAIGGDSRARTPLGPVLLFNLGVELGQLTVVGLAMLAVARVRARPWYRARVAIPASILIAAVGLCWTIERIFIHPG